MKIFKRAFSRQLSILSMVVGLCNSWCLQASFEKLIEERSGVIGEKIAQVAGIPAGFGTGTIIYGIFKEGFKNVDHQALEEVTPTLKKALDELESKVKATMSEHKGVTNVQIKSLENAIESAAQQVKDALPTDPAAKVNDTAIQHLLNALKGNFTIMPDRKEL
jgi:hypothetical protein